MSQTLSQQLDMSQTVRHVHTHIYMYIYMYVHIYIYVCTYIYICCSAAKSLQLCPTLCSSIDGSPPGSSVPGILQARTLEWVAISFSRGVCVCVCVCVCVYKIMKRFVRYTRVDIYRIHTYSMYIIKHFYQFFGQTQT